MRQTLRIFLAEDNQADILLVQEALGEHRVAHELSVARDTPQALTFIDRIGTATDAPCPDIILLDLNLPKGSGEEVFAAFRKHNLCKHTPVIVLTSSNAPKDRERAVELGVTHYFRKPCDLFEFLELGALIRTVAQEQDLPQEGKMLHS